MCIRDRCIGVVMLEVICHVLIQIFRLNLVAEAVRVGKAKPRPICAVLTLYMFVVKFVHEDFGQLQHHETSVMGLFCKIFFGANWTMTRSSLTIVKFLTVGFARAFLILFSLFTNSTLTHFLRLFIDFLYTLFDMSLKKSFSNSEVAAFCLSVLN